MAVVCLPTSVGPYGLGNVNSCVHGQNSHGFPTAFQHLVQPVICAQPSYRGPVLQSILASKPKSPPTSASSASTLESQDESEKCSTPYRLPRISPRTTPTNEGSPVPPSTTPGDRDGEDKVWGRFGYEDNIRMPELGPSIHKAMMNSPSPVYSYTPGHLTTPGIGSRSVVAEQQRYRQSAMWVPKFRNAVITPTVSSSQGLHIVRDVDVESVHVYKSLMEKVANSDPHNPAPTPIPNSRSVSPAKSTQSIHWALGSTRHPLFDYKGRGRKQGPYSREFTVHCMAPTSWMRMKWGRQQRTTVH